MSPSRRRATGAVRALAPRALARAFSAHTARPLAVPRCGRARCPHRAAAPRRGVRLGIPRPSRAHRPCGMAVRPVSGAPVVTGRRALRGYRGRTETPPAKLSACATCHYPWRITRAARWGHRALPPLHPRGVHRHFPRELPVAARCLAAGPPGSRRRAPARCAALHPAHSESFACRGSVRGMVRGRAAHPPRRRHSPVAARHSRPAVAPPDPGRKKRKRGNVLRFPPFRVYRRSIA